jgi:DNA-binding GntR family transcriptional regulator
MSAAPHPLEGLPKAANGTNVADALRLAILDGSLPPGTRLAQPQVARLFGTSRTPVREALHKLHSWGLVDLIVNHAALVRHIGPDQYSNAFAVWSELAALAVELTVAHDADVTPDLREVIQAEWAVIEETTHAVRQSRHIGERWIAAQRAFHEALIAGSKSERLRETIDTTTELMRWEAIWKAVADRPHPLRSAVTRHEEMLVLIERKDGAHAATTMRQHIEELREALVAWLARPIESNHNGN